MLQMESICPWLQAPVLLAASLIIGLRCSVLSGTSYTFLLSVHAISV